MKKLTAIFFLTIYLFSATECSELLKLPAFVSHYKEHKQEDNNLTLWQFLSIHYTGETKKDKDYDKDLKLPFKSHDNCTTQIVVTTPSLIALHIDDYKKIYSCIKNQYPVIDINISSSFLANIWQPPRIC